MFYFVSFCLVFWHTFLWGERITFNLLYVLFAHKKKQVEGELREVEGTRSIRFMARFDEWMLRWFFNVCTHVCREVVQIVSPKTGFGFPGVEKAQVFWNWYASLLFGLSKNHGTKSCVPSRPPYLLKHELCEKKYVQYIFFRYLI